MRPGWRWALVLAGLLAAAIVFVFFFPLWVQNQVVRTHLWREGVKSEYVDADGYRLHYLEALPANGETGTPLLLIHGHGAKAEDWSAMIAPLAAQVFHVYAPDLLGYGRSPKPDVSYSISLEEASVVEFMKAVHVTRADVGGWSMGGWIAMKLAADHPALINRLILYDSAGIYFPATFAPDLFTPSDVAGVRKLVATLTPNPVRMPDFAARAMVRKLQANAWVVRRSMASMMSGVDLMDFRLHGIQEPTLIVWGSKDALIPLPVGETLHRDIPNSLLDVIEGCGHLAPAECSKPVLEGTVSFLKARPPMQGGEKEFAAGH